MQLCARTKSQLWNLFSTDLFFKSVAWCCCSLPLPVKVDYQLFNIGMIVILTVHPIISFVIFFTWPSVNTVKGCTKSTMEHDTFHYVAEVLIEGIKVFQFVGRRCTREQKGPWSPGQLPQSTATTPIEAHAEERPPGPRWGTCHFWDFWEFYAVRWKHAIRWNFPLLPLANLYN